MSHTRRFKDVAELSEIHSPEELIIDYDEAIKAKKGELQLIQGEAFRCRANNPSLAHIPLILKRLQCIDRRTYDFKVYEADQLRRLRGHPNLVSLHSYWSEKSNSAYVYKTLVLLLEAGPTGNLAEYLSEMETPKNQVRFILKCAGDIAKGLVAIHTLNLIHGGIKPNSIYVSLDGSLILGELCKAELDTARQTQQLFTKMLIADAIRHTLIYWAPELFGSGAYTSAIDLWSLGVTLYQMATQKQPFRTTDEVSFREDLLAGNVDWEPLSDMPEVDVLVRHLLLLDSDKRWDAKDVLAYIQSYLVIDIQRRWRGCIFPYTLPI